MNSFKLIKSNMLKHLIKKKNTFKIRYKLIIRYLIMQIIICKLNLNFNHFKIFKMKIQITYNNLLNKNLINQILKININ